MANKKGIINLNYNLKDKSEELTLVYLIGYHKKRFKISTKQYVYVNTLPYLTKCNETSLDLNTLAKIDIFDDILVRY